MLAASRQQQMNNFISVTIEEIVIWFTWTTSYQKHFLLWGSVSSFSPYTIDFIFDDRFLAMARLAPFLMDEVTQLLYELEALLPFSWSDDNESPPELFMLS